MMYKGLFFSLSSISVNKTLMPMISRLEEEGYDMICYNTSDFKPERTEGLKFKAYPDYLNGYKPADVDSLSYFKFSNSLIDTAAQLIDFLISEVELEQPDFIVHSHLALWGKIVAGHFKLPAISLFTTFVLDKNIMMPFFKTQYKGNGVNFDQVKQLVIFNQTANDLNQKLDLTDKIDIWDAYVNKEPLNVVFIPVDFQPEKKLLDANFHFVGFPCLPNSVTVKRDIVYISMGTIFNDNKEFYQLCLLVLKEMGLKAVFAIGHKIKAEELGPLPPNIQVIAAVDQIGMLNSAFAFISRGGMVSIQEAICCQTPMIVIPEIPEQYFTAKRVTELGIGMHLSPAEVTKENLKEALKLIITDQVTYQANLKKLNTQIQSLFPLQTAFKLIDHYLNLQHEAAGLKL